MKSSTAFTIAILVLISAIVTWASFSFATPTATTQWQDVTVANAQFNYDSAKMIVTASGQLPNPCTMLPRPELALTAQPGVLTLKVAAEQSTAQCIQMVGAHYQLAFDVRSLKFELANLKINPNAAYTIVANSGHVVINLDFSKVPYTRPFATDVVPSGVLAVENNGRFTVSVPDGQAFTIVSPLINLNRFVGQEVGLEGHVVSARRPGFNLVNDSSADASILLVTGLSSTSN